MQTLNMAESGPIEAADKPIGGNDLLIAAYAGALGATVVTANVQEFERDRRQALGGRDQPHAIHNVRVISKRDQPATHSA